MTAAPELTVIRGPADAELLAAFYDQVYLPAFHHQREPLAVWTAQLWGDAPAAYELSIVVAGDAVRDPARRRLDGGVVSELYPASGCGLLTYLVVAPHARTAGLGRTLLARARRALADRAAAHGVELALVLGEVSDPARVSAADAPAARERLARFERWGARVVDLAYVQPSLGPGLPRDPDLLLIAFFDGEPPATIAGPPLATFLRDFYAITERAPAAPVSVPDRVALRPPGA